MIRSFTRYALVAGLCLFLIFDSAVAQPALSERFRGTITVDRPPIPDRPLQPPRIPPNMGQLIWSLPMSLQPDDIYYRWWVDPARMLVDEINLALQRGNSVSAVEISAGYLYPNSLLADALSGRVDRHHFLYQGLRVGLGYRRWLKAIPGTFLHSNLSLSQREFKNELLAMDAGDGPQGSVMLEMSQRLRQVRLQLLGGHHMAYGFPLAEIFAGIGFRLGQADLNAHHCTDATGNPCDPQQQDLSAFLSGRFVRPTYHFGVRLGLSR